jgi:benzoyl-CoA reductase subunit B
MEEPKKISVEPLKTWKKAKELRQRAYENFVNAKEKGGLRIAGMTIHPAALVQAFGRDVVFLGSEPYCAGVANWDEFAIQCQEACEKRGMARDLCGYMKNYWGGILIDKFMLPDHKIVPWPKPDLFFTTHYCCCHSKWYQYAAELEGGVPCFGIDISYRQGKQLTEEAIDYIVTQAADGIEWIEKHTRRKFDDELFIEYAMNEFNSNALWAQAYLLNQAVPAPMEEKSLYSYFFFNMISPHLKEVSDLFRELRDELQDRVKRGIGAIEVEKLRILSDGPPTWAMLQVFRFMEREYGAVIIASFYTSHWGATWDMDESGNLVAPKPPQKGDFASGSRENRLRKYFRWRSGRSNAAAVFIDSPDKIDITIKMAKQWKCDAVFMQLNRGCEGVSLGIMENKFLLQSAGIPVLTYEGNMGDARDFDLPATISKIEVFFENIGLKKLSKN